MKKQEMQAMFATEVVSLDRLCGSGGEVISHQGQVVRQVEKNTGNLRKMRHK